MRKIHSLLVLFALASFSCLQHDDFSRDDGGTKEIDYSVAEAKDFFHKYVSESPFLEAEYTRSHEADPLFGIDITPDWLNSVLTQQNGLISVDVPIFKTRDILVYRIKENEDVSVVKAVQKLIVVKGSETAKEGAYLMTCIPEMSYCPYPKYMSANDFVNTGKKGKYTGWVVYSMALTSKIVRLDYYMDGKKQYGLHTFGDKEKNRAAINRINEILSEMTFTINQQLTTRAECSIGEVEVWRICWACGSRTCYNRECEQRCNWCYSRGCDGSCRFGPGQDPNPDDDDGGGGGGGGGDGGGGDGGGGEYYPPFVFYPEPDPQQLICYNCSFPYEQCQCITFSLSLSKSDIEIASQYSITGQLEANNYNIKSVQWSMSRSGEGSFVNVHVGNGLESKSHSAQTFTMSRISMSPGRWTVRATVELEPASYIKFPVFTTTTEIEVAEQYPHVDKILKNYHTDLYTLWTKAENYAEQEKATHKAREFGAEIYLKKDGSHEAKEVEPGEPVTLDLNNKNLSASISFTSHLYDSRRAPATTRDIMIAVLHTHFPRKWAIPLESGKAGNIAVGPSGGDKISPVPGLLIDYAEEEKVPPGHEFTAPKKIYQDGPTSRRIALP